MNICVSIFSRCIMAGAVELIEFLLLSAALFCLCFCVMCLFESVFACAFFMICFWAVV
jgi:hypothetical protein